MKTIKHLFFSAIFTLTALSTSAQTFENPVQYSDYIIGIHSKFNTAMIEYTIESVHSDDLMAKEKIRINIMKQINTALADLKALPDYEGDTRLRDEAIEVFKLYKESFSIDIPNAEKLQANKKSSYEAMMEYMKANDKASAKVQKTSKRFKAAHEAFAEKHNIMLQEAEVDERMDIITETHKYNNDIYLQFFRVNMTTTEFNDAWQQQKPALMEAKRKKLIEDANAALLAIREIKAYKGEKKFRQAAIEYIEYVRNLAKNEFTEVIAILKSEERTNADVERYNSISNEFVNQSNKLSVAYQNAATEFLRTYIPKE